MIQWNVWTSHHLANIICMQQHHSDTHHVALLSNTSTVDDPPNCCVQQKNLVRVHQFSNRNWISFFRFRVLLGLTGPSVFQENRVPLEFGEITELQDVKASTDLQVQLEVPERRETPERTDRRYDTDEALSVQKVSISYSPCFCISLSGRRWTSRACRQNRTARDCWTARSQRGARPGGTAGSCCMYPHPLLVPQSYVSSQQCSDGYKFVLMCLPGATRKTRSCWISRWQRSSWCGGFTWSHWTKRRSWSWGSSSPSVQLKSI